MNNNRPKIALARQMRRALTTPEHLMWDRLKLRRNGIVFRRQHPLGPYILDFYCYKARLAVEIDGALHGHDNQPMRDEARDRYLTSLGIDIYRIPAAEVYRDPDGAADGLRLKIDEIMRRPK